MLDEKVKKGKILEIGAVGLTVLGICVAVFLPFRHEAGSLKDKLPAGAQVIELTGVATTGTWTDRKVTGSNYWKKDFPAARPVLKVGKPALFRLKSADVIHSFYIPSLGIGPVEVDPGHVVEFLVTPKSEGVFGYYCPTMCGDPHFAMRGVIMVQGEGRPFNIPEEHDFGRYWMLPPPPPGASRVDRGRWLLHQKGCATCHGFGGNGGIPNFNYVNDTVPALNTLARKMFLFYPEDVEIIVQELERGVSLESLEEDDPVPRFSAVLAQYESIVDVIKMGRSPGKKDPDGPPPPLEMPAWEFQLTDEEIESIITYLLSTQPFEEEEEG
jgi:hypothetical protein